MNVVNLCGRLGKDPELKEVGETKICEFSLATREYTKKKGSYAEWHNVKLFGSYAENAAKWLRKGNMVAVTGALQTSSWEDKDTKKKMYRTEILGYEFENLTPRSMDNEVAGEPEFNDQDVPF